MHAQEEPLSKDQRAKAAAYGLSFLACILLAAPSLLGRACEVCHGGILSVALPWAGMAFYGSLALLALLRPRSRILALAPGFYLFVHAGLLTEMILGGRPCLGCILTAAAASAAAAFEVHRSREWLAPAAAIAMGIAGGFLSPFDRVDEALTRTISPSRILENVPSWVDRADLKSCEDPSLVRVVIYEKDCRTCGSASRRLFPRLKKDYAAEVCTHLHELARPPEGAKLPLVIVTGALRVVVIEGTPDYERLKETVDVLLRIAPRKGGAEHGLRPGSAPATSEARSFRSPERSTGG